jgi:hypothetical protein
MRFGWCSPREYVLTHWLFAFTWGRGTPIRFVRVLGFYFDFSSPFTSTERKP